MKPLEVRDLCYDPDVRTRYGPASNARMAALHERLKAVLARTKAENEARASGGLGAPAETGGRDEE